MYLKREHAGDAEIIADSLDIPLRRTTNAILSLAERELLITEDGTAAELSVLGRDCDIIATDASIYEELKKEPGNTRAVFDHLRDHPLTSVNTASTALEISEADVEEAIARLEQIGIPARDRIT